MEDGISLWGPSPSWDLGTASSEMSEFRTFSSQGCNLEGVGGGERDIDFC